MHRTRACCGRGSGNPASERARAAIWHWGITPAALPPPPPALAPPSFLPLSSLPAPSPTPVSGHPSHPTPQNPPLNPNTLKHLDPPPSQPQPQLLLVQAIPRITSKGVMCGAVYKVASQPDVRSSGIH